METDKIITLGELLKYKKENETQNKKAYNNEKKDNAKKYQLFGEFKKQKNLQTLQSKI